MCRTERPVIVGNGVGPGGSRLGEVFSSGEYRVSARYRDDARAGDPVVRKLAFGMQPRGAGPCGDPCGGERERDGYRQVEERMQRERRQEPQPAERIADERVACAQRAAARRFEPQPPVFIGSVWPPWVQNQTKYAPTTSAIQAASRL